MEQLLCYTLVPGEVALSIQKYIFEFQFDGCHCWLTIVPRHHEYKLSKLIQIAIIIACSFNSIIIN